MAIFIDKKRKIVLAAISEFAKDGFEKASIESIALKAKVAKGTVFYHFRSKQELFAEIVDEGQKTFEEILIRKTKDLKNNQEKIEKLVEIEVDFIHRYRDLFSIYLGEMIKKVVNFEVIEKILVEGIENEEFRKDLDIRTTAVALFWLTAMTTINSKEVKARDLNDLVLRGILK